MKGMETRRWGQKNVRGPTKQMTTVDAQRSGAATKAADSCSEETSREGLEPQMDGYVVCQRITRRANIQALPIGRAQRSGTRPALAVDSLMRVLPFFFS